MTEIGRVPKTAPVAVVGAGTMGAGIAQVAAVAGHPVIVYDAAEGAAGRAVAAVRDRVARLVAKGRLDLDPSGLQLAVAADLGELAPAGCVIEAVAEDLAVKQALFADLEKIVAPDCVLATNTSSLSPTAIAAGLSHPGRLVGLHFFNPAPVMRLVEVVSGLATDPAVAAAVTRLAQDWGKQVVQASATPGFIVNRVARPFYAEALRLAEERAASPATIDAVLTQAGGFRMGPFALMDLVGQDVNEAVTRSVWAAFGYDPRFAPSLLQRAMVEAGWLGRKTGRGWYPLRRRRGAVGTRRRPGPFGPALCHRARRVAAAGPARPLRGGDPGGRGPRRDGRAAGWRVAGALRRQARDRAGPLGPPVVVVDRTLDDATAEGIAIAASDGCAAGAVDEATGLLQAAGLTVYVIDDAPGLVVTRTVAMLVNGAVDARHKGVASAADIDTAMRLGTNYPLGPLAWGQRWGPATVLGMLDAMQAWYGEDRYRPSALLRRIAAAGGDLRENCMTLTWTKENSPRWDADKQRVFGPAELAAVGLAGPAPGEPVADEWWRVTDGDQVAGYGWLDTEWGDARITFVVAPGRRGRGVGAFILERLEDEAAARGLNYIYNVVPGTHPDGAWIRNWLSTHGFHEASRGQLRRQVVTSAGSR